MQSIFIQDKNATRWIYIDIRIDRCNKKCDEVILFTYFLKRALNTKVIN